MSISHCSGCCDGPLRTPFRMGGHLSLAAGKWPSAACPPQTALAEESSHLDHASSWGILYSIFGQCAGIKVFNPDLWQFWWTILASELPVGSVEGHPDTASEVNCAIFPILLPPLPLHKIVESLRVLPNKPLSQSCFQGTLILETILKNKNN